MIQIPQTPLSCHITITYIGFTWPAVCKCNNFGAVHTVQAMANIRWPISIHMQYIQYSSMHDPLTQVLHINIIYSIANWAVPHGLVLHYICFSMTVQCMGITVYDRDSVHQVLYSIIHAPIGLANVQSITLYIHAGLQSTESLSDLYWYSSDACFGK